MLLDVWDYFQYLNSIFIKESVDISLIADKHIGQKLNEFSLRLDHFNLSAWKFHIYFEKHKHEPRLKLLRKETDVCEFYVDNEESKKNGRLCSKVPKEIISFIELLFPDCWDVFRSYTLQKKNVYKCLDRALTVYSYGNENVCEVFKTECEKLK